LANSPYRRSPQTLEPGAVMRVHAGFVHVDHWALGIIGLLVEFQHLFHVGHKVRTFLRWNHPALMQVRFERVFLRVHCITADALYGTAPFVDGASAMFGGVQVISQIRSNQKVRVQKREQHVADYFATHPGTPHTIRIRGGQEVIAIVGSARLYVSSHKTKRFVVALKYEGEETYRYLIASDLTWRTLDIIQGHTLRWLVEVFIRVVPQ